MSYSLDGMASWSNDPSIYVELLDQKKSPRGNKLVHIKMKETGRSVWLLIEWNYDVDCWVVTAGLERVPAHYLLPVKKVIAQINPFSL